jgi:hypothetical protein
LLRALKQHGGGAPRGLAGRRGGLLERGDGASSLGVTDRVADDQSNAMVEAGHPAVWNDDDLTA